MLVNKNTREKNAFTTRLTILCIVTTVLVFIILARILQLQVIEHQKYSGLSKHNYLAIIPTPAPRGVIYDRNGVVLAKNTPSFTLTVTRSKISHLQATLTRLGRIIPLSKKEKEAFLRSSTQYHHYEPTPLKYNLSESQVAQFYVHSYQFNGVNIATTLSRSYPQGKEFAHVVGYVGRITNKDYSLTHNNDYRATHYVGKSGIEKYYENELHGKPGIAIAQINAGGKIISQISETPAQSGQSIQLTIDSRLQHTAYQLLAHHSGALVALNPRDGSVIAMASNPSFDPNSLVNGISHKGYQQLLSAEGHPLFNKITRGLYSPGSTIKPLIAIGALSEHLITTESSIFDKGWFRLPKTKHIYHDWKYDGHGWVNVYKALTVSCDTFFYSLAVQMGINRLDNDLIQFGFGHLTGLDLPNESTGLVPTPGWKKHVQHAPWYTGDTIITGIGQGSLLVTPVQLAAATAALAMRGERYQPHLLSAITSATTVQRPQSYALPPAYLGNSSSWKEVISAMINVIKSPHGTAVRFGKDAPYSAAAKTGTAQVYRKKRRHYVAQTDLPMRLRNNHLFIAFAPTKQPRIALAVIIEHEHNDETIARQFLNQFFHLYPAHHRNTG